MSDATSDVRTAIVEGELPGFFISLDDENDTLTADDATTVAFGPQILVDWEETVEFILAVPRVAAGLRLLEAVENEPDADLVDLFARQFSQEDNDRARVHNTIFAHLRVIAEGGE